VLFERAQIAAGASGRNSGAVQSPFDPVFAALHRRSVELYRESAIVDAGFVLPAAPAGLMLISFEEPAVEAMHAGLVEEWPELQPTFLRAGAATRSEAALHPDLAACQIRTGYPVAPAIATNAFATRALAAGAELVTGSEARVLVEEDRAIGVATETDIVACERVLVAAGPSTPDLVSGWEAARPISPVWGVVATTHIPSSPTNILEELGIGKDAQMSGRLFSLVTVGDSASIGSTFLPDAPDETLLAAEIMARGARFVPALATAEIQAIRTCARPASMDGRPIIGAIPHVAGLFVCAGHGPWGISTGPASAELVINQMLHQGSESLELSPSRVGPKVATNTEFE
jgi:glycine/D-amino acid oxidase-like deaminating enzyme